ncbi:glycosyl hydrolase family 18 protein [Paenibacillus yanchengensis]|uniref:Glycosyl hydrolase family 18 protein n=1 Tax=Paenibacillus yanchengensis TaxID=2035833 RepID=A0ABW4YFA6_9BACL
MLIHTINQGDTMSTLSQQYQLDLEHIAIANGLTSASSLVIGQAIIIPLTATVTEHRTNAGETLADIAQQYGVTISAVQQMNQLHNPALIEVGVPLHIPAIDKQPLEINAYCEAFSEVGAALVREASPSLTYLSPFSYLVKADGTLLAPEDGLLIDSSYEHSLMPMMVITNLHNGTFDSQITHTIFHDNIVQQRLLEQITSTMLLKGYTALNVDFEYVLPEDRLAYNQFLRTLTDRLHQHELLVATSLAPKTSSQQTGILYEAHDYEAHGQIVDFVTLMTYEWGWSGGPPRAVAPLNEIVKVLNYALSVIPANKIMLGMPLYGYDWSLPYVQGGNWAQPISSQEAIKRAATNNVPIQYDETAQSPYYYYTDEQQKQHIVWFEDARSIQAKLNIAKAHQLRGLSYWVLGLACPQNWTLIDNNVTVSKLL